MPVERETSRVRFRFRENGGIGNEECFLPEKPILLLFAERQSPAVPFGFQSDLTVTNQQNLVTDGNRFPSRKASFFQFFVENARFGGRQNGKGG